MLNVIGCIPYEFPAEFIGFLVLGGVLYFFLPRGRARRGTALGALIVYGVCEFVVTVICQGHLNGILAVFLGMLGLGLACGLALCTLAERLFRPRKIA